MSMGWKGVVAQFRDRIRVQGDPVTLLEGNTPLIPAPRIAAWLGVECEIYFKFEGLNPTGSFKDRGMTAAVTEAANAGSQTVICASTGNTAASAAAYAARAGMQSIVLVPDGKIALGKLAASIAYGARVLQIEGSFDEALRLVRQASEKAPISLVNSLNQARLEGQKTSAWEIREALGRTPDWLALPVGNAGNITAYWMGFTQDVAEGFAKHAPRILGAQASGSAPILDGNPVDAPDTIATAIRIGHPARWCQAWTALRESSGQIWRVTDEEILRAYQALATLEGIFCESSSAAGLAGLKKSVEQGRIELEGKTIACVLTGHGLKDPDTALSTAKPPMKISATLDDLLRVIG